MNSAAAFVDVAGRLMRSPAIAYHEQLVAREVVRFCEEAGLPHRFDPFGNIHISVVNDPSLRPTVLAAHMDHPGFLLRQEADGRTVAEFRGGVGDVYFKPGIALKLVPGGTGRLGRRISERQIFELEAGTPGARFAVWDIPEFAMQDGMIHGRACDDLIGVAAILTTLSRVRNERVNLHGFLSRAEEVGFHGALAAADAREIPSESLVVSLETSRELPPVKMGEGAILRIGDRASVFSSTASRFFAEVAADLLKQNQAFGFQRALMPGGTCEATAFQEHGYETAALCVALGNYHNCGANDCIAAEFVSLDDALNMVDLLCEAARRMPDYGALTGRLTARLQSLRKEALKALPSAPLE